MKIMKLGDYKDFLINLKTENLKNQKTNQRKNKRTKRRNKKIKTSIGKSNHSIKSKCLKWIVKKILPALQSWLSMINIEKKEKPKYVKKTQLLCSMQKKTKSKSIKGVALENKIGQQKSICVDCDSGKSTFLKSIKPIKNEKIVFTSYKTCKYIVKTVKNTQVTRFQKVSSDFKE